MKHPFFIFLLIGFLIVACNPNGVSPELPDHNSPEVPLPQPAHSFSGTVQNYQGGTMTIRGLDLNGRKIGEGSIAVDGSFTFSYQQNIDHASLSDASSYACEGATVSKPDAGVLERPFVWFFSPEHYYNRGVLALASSESTALMEGDRGEGDILVVRFYATEDVAITGTCQSEPVTFNLSLKAGWNTALLRWNDSGHINVVTGPMPSSGMNWYASVVDSTHTVTVNITGAGSVTIEPPGSICVSETEASCVVEVDSEELVTFTAQPEAGLVTEWEGICNESFDNTCRFVVGGSTTVSIAFVEGVPLTVSVSGPGHVWNEHNTISCTEEGGTCTGYFRRNTYATLNISGNLTGWTGACEGRTEISCSVYMDTPKTTTAHFE